jgi:hypothetical protein
MSFVTRARRQQYLRIVALTRQCLCLGGRTCRSERETLCSGHQVRHTPDSGGQEKHDEGKHARATSRCGRHDVPPFFGVTPSSGLLENGGRVVHRHSFLSCLVGDPWPERIATTKRSLEREISRRHEHSSRSAREDVSLRCGSCMVHGGRLPARACSPAACPGRNASLADRTSGTRPGVLGKIIPPNSGPVPMTTGRSPV